MKRLILALLAIAFANAAVAQVVPTLPFQLQNGTTADASQVMSNFNTIVTGVNTNAATAGTNTNITALVGLTTPLAPAVGGTPVFIGGTSAGSANAQTVSTTPSNFTLVAGYRVTFIPGFTNTGPLTLNVGGTGALAVYRQTPSSAISTYGGEVVAGSTIDVVYDGTRWQILSNSSPLPPGMVVDYAAVGAPPGWLVAAGQCVSRTQYASLFGIYGTGWGACDGSTTFGIPDLRGRVTAGADDMGGTAAGRLTTLTIASPSLGGTGGSQTFTIGTNQLPGHTHNYSGTTTFNGDHNHNYSYISISPTGGSFGASGVSYTSPSNTGTTTNSGTHQHSYSGTTDNGSGGGQAVNNLQPTAVMTKIIKY